MEYLTVQQDGLIDDPGTAIDKSVTMSNHLARAAHGLNLSEKRLVAMGLASTDSVPLRNLTQATNSGWKMRISAQDYAEAFGVTPQTAYEQLQSAATNLFSRYVSYKLKGRRGLEEKRFRWVSAAHYAAGEGFVELNFSPEIAPHLLGLRKQFTTYKLKQAGGLDSVYAWRLFEVLKSWQSTGVYTTTIEDFWNSMEAPPSCRKDFKALRLRIIEPSVASIASKANVQIEWRQIRSGGRRVTGLEFVFAPDPQGKLLLDSDPLDPDQDADDDPTQRLSE
jgi:plasmid replication initiation protein